MSQGDSSISEANSTAWREANRLVRRAAKDIIVQLCQSGEWVRRSVLVAALRQHANPEHLVRVCQMQACRCNKKRPNRISLDRQAYSGAKRAISCAVSDLRRYQIVENRGIGDNGEVRLLRIPQRRHRRDL